MRATLVSVLARGAGRGVRRGDSCASGRRGLQDRAANSASIWALISTRFYSICCAMWAWMRGSNPLSSIGAAAMPTSDQATASGGAARGF